MFGAERKFRQSIRPGYVITMSWIIHLDGINLIVLNVIFSLAVTSGMLEPFLEGQTLEEALTARRIFIVNLEILSRLNLDEPRKVSRQGNIITVPEII